MDDKSRTCTCDACGKKWIWNKEEKKLGGTTEPTQLLVPKKDEVDKNILLFFCSCDNLIATYDTGFDRLLFC